MSNSAFWGTVVATSITAISMIITQLIISKKQEKIQDLKSKHALEMYEQRTDLLISEIKTDISRLEEKQNKHNNLIERTAVLERDLKTAFYRIDDIKSCIHE